MNRLNRRNKSLHPTHHSSRHEVHLSTKKQGKPKFSTVKTQGNPIYTLQTLADPKKSSGTPASFLVFASLCERLATQKLPLRLQDSFGFSPNSPL